MYLCHICKKEFDNIRKLSKHIRDNHKNISLKDYYDIFILKCGEDKCCICGDDTKYIGFGAGYRATCCRSHSAMLHRRHLREDAEKFKAFSGKVSSNMMNEWKKNQDNRVYNIRKAIRLLIDNMNTEHKKNRFGYINKLSQKDRDDFIEKMKTCGMFSWWNNATCKEKEEVYHKRAESLRKTWDIDGHNIMKRMIMSSVDNRVNNILPDNSINNENLNIIFDI